jgi:hypothetical protein
MTFPSSLELVSFVTIAVIERLLLVVWRGFLCFENFARMCEPLSSSLPAVGTKVALLVESSPSSEGLLAAVDFEHRLLGDKTSERNGAATEQEPHQANDMLCEHSTATQTTCTSAITCSAPAPSSEVGTHRTDDTTRGAPISGK